MHGLAADAKEEVPFARDLSLENSADSYLTFRVALLHSVSLFQWMGISYNIDEVLSINLSANVFVFEDFTSIIRTGQSILVELIDMANSVIIILSQMTLLRWLTFLLRSLTVALTVLLDLFISCDAIICFTIAFPPLGNFDHVVVSVFIKFMSNPIQEGGTLPFFLM